MRDMLCAQALQVVSRALKGLKVGKSVRVLYNSEDVKNDLLVWAADRGHATQEGPGEIVMVKMKQNA